MQIMTINHFV